MKKSLPILFLAFVMLFALAACATEKYTVKYVIDGNNVHEEQIEAGSGAKAGWTPQAVEGFTFDGWYTDENCTGEKFGNKAVEENVTLYGRWIADEPQTETFTVTFMVNGVPTEVPVSEGKTASMENPAPETGYIFKGWYLNEDGEGEKFALSTPITEDLTLYAVFMKLNVKFTVSFDIGEGTASPAISAQQIDENGKAVKPQTAPQLDGCNFIGWFDADGNEYSFDAPVTESFVLYAKYMADIPATEGTAAATSSAENFAASNAVDGEYSTYWKAAEEGENSLTIDLGSMCEVRKITQIFHNADNWKFRLLGSADGDHYAELADFDGEAEKESYSANVNGFFRYIRLTVFEGTATCRELSVQTFDLSDGTNVALGMKGSAGSWAGGFETEKAFDGDYSTYFCSNDGNYPAFLAVEWNYLCAVKFVDVYMVDPGNYNYAIEVRLADGSWETLVPAADYGQQTRIAIGKEVSAVLIRLNAGPGWPAVLEMNVYGFRNRSYYVQPEEINGYNVYDLGDGYISYIAPDDADGTVEYSADGQNWTYLTVTDGIAEAGVKARYVRLASQKTAKIFATPFLTDLAQYVAPTASETTDAGQFGPQLATMNKENVWVAERFWCATNDGQEKTLSLDFGKICVLTGFTYKFRDEQQSPVYYLKIEISADNAAWTSIYDISDTGSGQATHSGSVDNLQARYVRITVRFDGGFCNCDLLQFFGTGSPDRYVEIR